MKFTVTPELAILLKTVRTQNGISSKDLAGAIEKSPSYVSKLEAGSVKTIQKDLLTSIITFITGGGDFFEECLPGMIKTLRTFLEPERAMSQTWLLQYDIVDRPIAVPAEFVGDLSARLSDTGTTVQELVDLINANPDSEMSESFPENVVLTLPYEEGQRLLVRIAVEPERIDRLLSGADLITNHLTANVLAFTVLRLQEYGADRTKMKPDKAAEVLRDTATLMGQYDVHSLTGFSHMLSSDTFIERQTPMAWPALTVEDDTVMEAIRFFNEAMEHDAINTRKALDSLLEALNWDPGFTMKLMSLPFSELEGLSFQNKRKLLEELEAVLEKYNAMSDFEKRFETY